MVAEGNETPGGESGGAPEGRSLRSEGDLLAERRARRAAESGEHALTLRAEAAEATVRTLETHLASLQQRVREADEEHRRLSEAIEADQPPLPAPTRQAQAPAAEEVERELRRVSQREYAEQRLRMEAEDRCVEIERDGRAEIDRLSQRLSASEHDARALAAQLETVQRELADAEESAAAELADLRSVAVQRADAALQARVADLERRTLQINAGLEAERGARTRAERLLEEMRGAQRTAIELLAELGEVVGRLRQDAAAMPPDPPEAAPLPPPLPAPAALRSIDAVPVDSGGGEAQKAQSSEMAEALAAAVERLRARVEEQPEPPPAARLKPPPHKHTMSLIGRSRLALRRRREARKQRDGQ